MTARTTGRANRAQGLALEDALDAQHAIYAAQGLAHMTRIPTPVTVIGRTTLDARGRACFRACFAARTGVDFVGWARPNGQVVPCAVEAKTHSGDGAWDSGLRPGALFGVGCGGLTIEQAAQMRTYVLAGCHAVIILRAWGATWCIDYEDLATHVDDVNRRTVRPTEVGDIGRRLVGVDWLGVG